MSYRTLVHRIMEFTVRAALARSIDESEWEHEELRRHGLSALQIFRNGKAIWLDSQTFETECAEATSRGDLRFELTNQLDPALYEWLERDLRASWREAGYQVPHLLRDMKKLFTELERDAAERASGAREALIVELLGEHVQTS